MHFLCRTKNMAVFMQEIATGFDTGCAAVNQLPSQAVIKMCHHVLGVLQDGNSVDTPDFSNICNIKNESEYRKVQLGINTIMFIFRTAKLTKPTSEDFLKKLKSINLLDEEPLNILAKLWTEQIPNITRRKTDHLLSIGKLLDMQWKAGLATSSSDCRNLNKPFVTVILKVQQSPGTFSTHTVEMTIPEFKEFSTQIRNMTNVLETA